MWRERFQEGFSEPGRKQLFKTPLLILWATQTAGKATARRSVYKEFKNSVVIFMHAFRSFLKSPLSIASNAATITFDRLLILSINASRCFSKTGVARYLRW